LHTRSSSDSSYWAVTSVFGYDGDKKSLPSTTGFATCLLRGQLGAASMTDSIDYLAIQNSKTGSLLGSSWEAQLSGKVVSGFLSGSAPYDVSWLNTYSAKPEIAIFSQNGEQGGNGGWSIGYEVDKDACGLAIDETDTGDRKHTGEYVGIFAFEKAGVYPLRKYASTDPSFNITDSEEHLIESNKNYTNDDGLLTWYWDSFNFSSGNYTAMSLASKPGYLSSYDYKYFELTPDNTSPNIYLRSPLNNSWSNSGNITFNYTPEDNSHHFNNCSLFINGIFNQSNSAITNNASNLFIVNNLDEGLFSWSINCTDYAGNSNISRTDYFRVDKTKPSLILNQPIQNYNSSSPNINLNFTAIDNMDTEMLCNLTVDNSIKTSSIPANNNSFTNSTITLAHGTHYWNVTCWDNASNVNTSITKSFFVDLHDPEVQLKTPQDNTYSNNQSIIFRFNVTDEAPSKCTLYNNVSGIWKKNQTIDANNNSINSFSPIIIPEGNFIWDVVCNDTSGRNGTSPTNFTLHIDITDPLIGYSGDIEDGAILSQNWIFINVSITEINEKNVTFNLYNNLKTLINSTTLGSQNRTFNFTNLNDGLYHYNVTVYDKAGNFNSTSTYNITLDTHSPEVTLKFPDNATWLNSVPINFTYNATDSNLDSCTLYTNKTGSFEKNTTQNSLISGQQNNFLMNFSDGTYIWNVKCNDSANNIAFSQYNYTFYLDTQNGSIKFISPTPSDSENISSTQVTINISHSEPNPDTLILYFDSDVYKRNYSGTYTNLTITGLTDGTHTFYAWMNDSAGNTNITETRNITIDTTPPSITLTSPQNDTWSNTENNYFNFTANDTLQNIRNCSLIINNAINQTKSYNSRNINSFFNLTLSTGEFNWTINCTDTLGNEGNNETRVLKIDLINPKISNPNVNATNVYVKDYICLNVTASDANSGISGVWAKIKDPYNQIYTVYLSDSQTTPCDNANGNNVYSALYRLTKHGIYNWTYAYAEDIAGNQNFTIASLIINVTSEGNITINMTSPASDLRINESESNRNFTFNVTCTAICDESNNEDCEDVVLYANYNYSTSTHINTTTPYLTNDQDSYSCGDLLNLRADWWNDSWPYRQEIKISNSAGDLTDYQMRIILNNSNTGDYFNWTSDENATRFVYYNETSLKNIRLSYWIQSWDSATNTSVIWVKVPSILNNANTTIYMYHGNSDAVSESNASSVFIYYSDGSSLTGWTNSGAAVITSNGNPQPSLEATGGNYAYRNIALAPNEIIEYDNYVIPGSVDLCNLYFLTDSSGSGQMFRLEARSGNSPGFASTSSWTSWNAPSGYTAISSGVWHNVKLVLTSNTAYGYIDGTSYGSYSFSNNGGYIAVHGDGGSVTGGDFDNIKVRKYVSNEPNAAINKNEQVLGSNPICSNTFTITTTLDSGNTNWNVWCLAESSNFGEFPSNEIKKITINDHPSAKLYYPTNMTWLHSVEILNASTSSDDQGISLYTFFLDNSTAFSSPAILCNSSDYNCTFNTLTQNQCEEEDNDCFLKLKVLDTEGLTNETTISIGIDNEKPRITLNNPNDNDWLSNNTINFNFTPTDVNLDSCSLFLDGIKNKTSHTLTSGIPNIITQNISEGTHTWNIYCNDSEGNSGFNASNRTIILDTQNPQISYSTGTDQNNTWINKNWIYVNISYIESNMKNITFYLYDNSSTLFSGRPNVEIGG